MPPAPAKRDAPEGVFVAGVGNVQNPEIIKSSKVQPRFPKAAEGKGVLGRVVLQAVVSKDGKEWGYKFDANGKLLGKHSEAGEHKEKGEKY